MKFRTAVEPRAAEHPISAGERIVTVGSCFSRAIGSRLEAAGLDIAVNPMGVLFNPVSIGDAVVRALRRQPFTAADLYRDGQGIHHALAFESRRQSTDPEALLDELNRDFDAFGRRLREADRWIVTFGTAWVFFHEPTQRVAGNCHKLPDSEFTRRQLSVDEITGLWKGILAEAPEVIFTVSPVRHLNDGLHGNTLSKARLHLAVETLCNECRNAAYFPAYEAVTDDLRDYRFYADDLKHPSAMAEEYVFEIFADTYFTRETRALIEAKRREALRNNHRPIIRK